jgi:hypothetical protein
MPLQNIGFAPSDQADLARFCSQFDGRLAQVRSDR